MGSLKRAREGLSNDISFDSIYHCTRAAKHYAVTNGIFAFFCIFVSLPCDTKFVVIASRSEFSADQNDRSYDLAVL